MRQAAAVEAVRRGAGLFRLAQRGLLEVRGGDRVRWLDGQLTNRVTDLAPAAPRSGCYALLLTPQGRIVADVHVMARADVFWLELARAALPRARERLEKYVIADDVALVDRSPAFARLGLEGPRARRILEACLGRPVELDAECVADVELAGVPVTLAAFGWSGETALQLLVPLDRTETVESALGEAGRSEGLVEAGPELLEVLRVEAGVPHYGSELDEDVLPAEARLLERAVSFTKGCYAGQEVVARMQSRDRVKHLLVGLALAGDAPPAIGAPVTHGDERVGAVTSAAHSPRAGPIALAYVVRSQAEPGTRLRVAGVDARVAPLPFVAPS